MCCNIEDAGFEIRDMLAWAYSTGFPKSLDVSKALDKAAGFWRGKAGDVVSGNGSMSGGNYERTPKGTPITAAAAAWQGWGTALKPAMEPITLARKPLQGTVIANVAQHEAGAINIDGCRVPSEPWKAHKASGLASVKFFTRGVAPVVEKTPSEAGRWPANLLHDGSDDVLGALGNAARFFYCAKPSRAERGEDNQHPTVKPLALMRYLCRLVTPPGGVVLDPFLGSGTTLLAASAEGFCCIGIERDESSCEIAAKRIERQRKEAAQMRLELTA
jgi:site-specific DNA-methyltransferase (adenine-specific)